MTPDTYLILVVFASSVCGQGILLWALRHQVKRYERFRGETGFVLTDMQEQLLDINRRLAAAGYPPGRVTPQSGPEWYRQRLLPDGTPAPPDLIRNEPASR